ncbi:MAG: RluA family pseudouridine synthase [Mariprofundaceae bacterium]
MSTASNSQLLTLTIPENMTGQRLDHALTCLSDLSRGRIQELLKSGRIEHTMHKQKLKASTQVCEADVFLVDVPDSQPLSLEPENIPLDILFEDEHLLVVNKAAGMVVHPSHGHDTGTLVHALLHHCPNLPGINGIERPGIVHRLDKDTSGSLVVAKSEAALHGLVELFSTHDINRQYLAWCRGACHWSMERIEAPIGRHPNHRQKMAIVRGAKHATTDAQRERDFNHQFSRMRLTLHTGRTHQIRVHLSNAGLPILADATYARNFNPGKDIPEPARTALQQLKRQALHAEVLGFVHPITAEDILCIAPLPDDLKNLNDALEESFS